MPSVDLRNIAQRNARSNHMQVKHFVLVTVCVFSFDRMLKISGTEIRLFCLSKVASDFSHEISLPTFDSQTIVKLEQFFLHLDNN